MLIYARLQGEPCVFPRASINGLHPPARTRSVAQQLRQPCGPTQTKAMRSLTFLLLLVACVATYGVFRPRPAEPVAAASTPLAARQAKGEALFASAFKRFGSDKLALAPLKGRPLIVYFWATWCAACHEEAVALMALQQRHERDGLAVIAIGVDQSDKLASFVREHQINYPVYAAGQEGIDLSKRMGNLLGELPYTVAIDRRGAFVAQQLGRHAQETLEKLAAAALQ